LSKKLPFHLAVELDSAAWRPALRPRAEPDGDTPLTPAFWVHQIRAAEHGGLDFVTIADCHRMLAPPRGRLDAVMIAARVAPLTRHIGIVPAASTTLTEPFLLSTQIATLDWVSGGRAGWQADVSVRAGDGGYVGPRPVPPAPDRYDEAADHIDVVRRLWDSWEDDAEIRDATTNRFIDRERVHHIDFEGPFFSVKGPSITPRPPQGQPVVAIVAADPPTRTLAAHCADVVLVAAGDDRELERGAAAVSDAAAAAGRDPADLRLLADVDVTLDDDPAAAEARRAQNGAAARGSPALGFAGTPASLAQRLIRWSELGVSGFRLRPAELPRDLEAITRRLTAELTSRRVRRGAYEATTLRGLLGLSRPANRYSTRV
jgi:alkanesulfonate monooxygenase SsuD/methylene tetrahydromethanopterin reductase-like flavin-dependent oxidoreductase (luciferase family)